MSTLCCLSSFRRHCAGLIVGTSLLLGGALLPDAVRAGEPGGFGNSLFGPDSGFSRRPLSVTVDTRVGYDDNTLDESRNKHDSVFVNGAVNVGYTAQNSRTILTLGASAGITYYPDRPGREYDPNVGLSLGLTYKLTPRATLLVSSSSVYQSEPDFGVVGIQERRNGDYFYTANSFGLAYRWTPRFSTVTSYNPAFFVYRQDPYSFYQDRAEHYFDQQFRLLVLPRLTLVGEYRFGYIDYFNDRNADFRLLDNGQTLVFVPDFHANSYNHFALVGVDYALGPRFRAGLRVGAQFRNYADDRTFFVVNGVGARQLDRNTFGTVLGPDSRIVSVTRDTETSPYVEGTLSYDLNRRGNLTLVTRYGIEEGNLAVSDSSRDSFRIGATYNQGFTARLGGYVGFYYTHNEYNNADGFNDFGENVYDVSAGLRYVINRHVALEVGYQHTTVDSGFSPFNNLDTSVGEGVVTLNDFNGRDYDRNRYFVGARFAF